MVSSFFYLYFIDVTTVPDWIGLFPYFVVFQYLLGLDLAPVFTEEEFRHWFIPRKGIIDSYVVEVLIQALRFEINHWVEVLYLKILSLYLIKFGKFLCHCLRKGAFRFALVCLFVWTFVIKFCDKG